MGDQDPAMTVHSGLAAACLKHSLPGDFCPLAPADLAAFIDQAGFHVRR
jgi:2-dehydro-3-deoxygluconokinase